MDGHPAVDSGSVTTDVKQREQRWPVLLLRTSPTWMGIVLSWIGLAILLDSALVIVVFLVAVVILAVVIREGRRRARSETRKQDPEALRRVARDTYLLAAGAVLMAVVVPAFLGVSTGSILFSLGCLLMVLGGFETRRLLRQGAADADQPAG